MTSGEGARDWPGLTYGATERMLAELNDTSLEGIRSRFRKLRLRPFPDDIRTGTGNRIVYDLRRLLALCAVFELNRLFVPQGHCVDLVESHWVELCRASLVAAHRLGVASAPASAPDGVASMLRLAANAFGADGPAPDAALSTPEPVYSQVADAPALLIDAARMVAALTSAARNHPGVAAAFGDLDASFGWKRPLVPHRATAVTMSNRRGFLEDGPYFERASMLFRSSIPRSRFERDRLQGLYEYLERPAPIDAWKGELGSDEERPRLKHLVSFQARELGLIVNDQYPETMAAAAPDDLTALALRYIAEARLT